MYTLAKMDWHWESMPPSSQKKNYQVLKILWNMVPSAV